MLVLVAVQSIIYPWMRYLSGWLLNGYYISKADETVEFFEVQPILSSTVIFMPILVGILFDFMKERKASDFYHSLPVYRSAMYVSNFLAIFTWTLIVVACSLAATFITYGLIPVFFVQYDNNLNTVLSFLVAGIYLSAVIILARNISGTRFTIAMTSLAIIIMPRAVIMFIYGMTHTICGEFLIEQTSIIWNPAYNVLWRFFGIFWNNELPIGATYIYTIILSLIYIAIAGVLFVTRKSEKAESIAITPVVQRVLSFVPPTLFCFLPIRYIIHMTYGSRDNSSAAFVTVVFLYIIAFFIYVLYEMITVRKFSLVFQGIKKAWILIVINVVLLSVISLNVEVIRRQKPTAEQIGYVCLRSDPARIIIPDNRSDELYAIRFDDIAVKEMVAEGLSNLGKTNAYFNYEYEYVELLINYDGKDIYRQLLVDPEKFGKALLGNKEFASILCELPEKDNLEKATLVKTASSRIGETMTNSDMELIYKTLQEEKANMSIDDWASVAGYTALCYDTDISLSVVFTFWSDEGRVTLFSRYDDEYTVYIDPDVLPKTYEILLEKYPYTVEK